MNDGQLYAEKSSINKRFDHEQSKHDYKEVTETNDKCKNPISLNLNNEGNAVISCYYKQSNLLISKPGRPFLKSIYEENS